MPTRFDYAYRNTKLQYDYHTLSILDFTDEELEKSNNPFAMVVLAAKTSLLEGKILESDLLDRKVLIASNLLKKGFSKRKIRAIFVFLEGYVLFEDPKMNCNFEQRIQSHDKNNIMGIDEYLKMIGKEEGLAEGMKKGMKKGIQKGKEAGIAEGIEKGTRLFVENLLKEGFSLQKIASLANVTTDFVKSVKKDLTTK